MDLFKKRFKELLINIIIIVITGSLTLGVCYLLTLSSIAFTIIEYFLMGLVLIGIPLVLLYIFIDWLIIEPYKYHKKVKEYENEH